MVSFLLGAALLGSAWGNSGYQFKPWPASQPTPGLTVTDLSGKAWELKALRGRVVLINFWASWCEPCVAEMPSLQALAQLHGPEKLQVLAVNFKQSVPAIQQFVQKNGLQLPVVADPQGSLARQWGIKVFPSTVLIDANGNIRGIVLGELDWTGIDAAALLQPLLEGRH